MIEVTCGACGSTLRFAEADVPPGGKTVTCTQCKARVAIPPRVPMPSIPAPNAGGGTGDVGGTASTFQFTDAVIRNL